MKFREDLLTEGKSYANHTPQIAADTMDCSLGVNPYGYSASTASVMDTFERHHLSDYPHSSVLQQALVQYWGGRIKPEELVAVNGSICGLYCLNNIFSQASRREVLGFAPSFTDMLESVRSFGMQYRSVPLRLAENGRAEVSDLLICLSEQTALVYLDRPNNPTGQTMPLADVERVVAAADAVGAYALIDEAYGDFIPREESALALWGQYDNLIVLKTFSKGFGLANLRAGYIVAPLLLAGFLEKTGNPYVLSDLTREIAAAALRDADYPMAHSADFIAAKQALRAVTGTRLTMLETDDRVPICTLRLNQSGDLQAMLLKEKILTVSGVEFEQLSRRYVRLRIPKKEETNRLLRAVAQIVQLN